MRTSWLIGFMAVVLVACQNKQMTTIHFNIQDYNETTPRMIVGFANYPVEIDSLGGGMVELDLQEPTYATIEVRKHDRRLVYLEPGKDLTLSYSMKKGEKEVDFAGELAKENRFLAQNGFYSFVPVNYKDRDIRQAARRADSVLAVNRQKLKEVSLSDMFKTWENKRLEVDVCAALLRAPLVDTALYLQTIQEKMGMDSSYLSIPAYREFLEQYVRMWVRVNGDKSYEGTELADRRLDCIFRNFEDPATLSYLVDKTLFHFGTSGIEKYKELYNRYVKDPARLALFADACKKADRIAPGNPCPDFEFTDNMGKSVSLKDLRGKYVYIDIWATWCGPCKGEMPSLLELEKRFEGKDITFVSLSVDKNKDIELWKKTIEQMGLGGIQLHLGENWEWLKNFMAASISVPRFILLDREGKIVNANMSRPSDKNTATTFEKLLANK